MSDAESPFLWQLPAPEEVSIEQKRADDAAFIGELMKAMEEPLDLSKPLGGCLRHVNERP